MICHLAQVNIAIARYQPDDPRFAGFVDNLDRINALADAAPGFVWRHVAVDDDAEAKAVFGDQALIFNMSLWQSLDALRDFVYRSDHVEILRRRADWFVPQDRPTMALWWHVAGSTPGITEARHRLDRLAMAGPSEDAFTFRHSFEAPQQMDEANG